MGTWKPLCFKGKDFQNRYLISDMAEIVDLETNKNVSIYTSKGFHIVRLFSDGVLINCALHDIVAENFVANPLGYKYIGFKDGNKQNCKANNLYWKYGVVYDTEEEYIQHRRKQYVNSVYKRRKNIKEKAIAYKGGKCQICGYNKCMAALEFHHLNPNEKDFQIANFYTRNWKDIKKELDKCILLCANCHREVENNITIL